MLLLRLAETAPGKSRGAVRPCGEDRTKQEASAKPPLELVLATGERLRIGPGVDVTTLRAVLDLLRG